MSPFQRHRARMMGELAAVQAADPAAQRRGGAATEYELQRARLGVDLRRLHELQSVERKIELKRQLLPGYVDWVEGVMAANVATEDDILTHVMIWRLDVGDFAGALPLARFVLRHGLTLPERFSRTAPTLICEEIADAALKALGQDQDFDIATLRDVEVLVIDEDIFDQVRAKLEKAIGLCLARAADAIEPDADGPAGARRGAQEQALRHLRRAVELDTNAGVKKRIEKLERDIRAAMPAPSADAIDTTAIADAAVKLHDALTSLSGVSNPPAPGA